MPDASSAGKIARFGMYELDLASGELRKNGSRIHLQEQPFQILSVLLERPGEMVSREELRTRLWSSDTFVDFDHGLNTAVNKLREALGDAAANPRFVETVARRGYRFIAPVQVVGAEVTPPVASPPISEEQPQPRAVLNEPEIHPELDVPIPRRGLTRGLFLLIQVMYLCFYLAALFRSQAVHQIADSFLPGWAALVILVAVLVTAGAGIPLRCYLISAAGFDHRQLGQKFDRMFPVILGLDQLWAVAPFLLAEKIGFGGAFAVTAALLYLPFSERTLIRMAYPAKI